MNNQCTFCSQCSLFKGKISLPEDVGIMYKYHYCLSQTEKWKECKRYTFENINGYCPDFVMPNSLLTIDQIWHRTQHQYAMQY